MSVIEKEIKEVFSDENNHRYYNPFQECLQKYEDEGVEDYSSLPENIKNIASKVIDLDKEETKLSIDFTHDFWKNNAHKYKLEYDTNYTNVIK